MIKKIVFFWLVVCAKLQAAQSFMFVDSKTQGALDHQFIQHLVTTFGTDIFFETGTYTAETTLNAVPYFKQIVTVELDETFCKNAHVKLGHYGHVKIYHDSSPQAIKRVAPQLRGKILFWLDAHYSGGNTALSFNDPNAPDAITAIRGELAAIQETGIQDCVILIDDIRGFGSEISGQEYLGCWAYPSVQEVQHDLLKINPHFKLALLGDTLLAYDGRQYQPSFSPAVIGCTKTRLYDGYNLTDTELIAAEEQIKKASPQEKKYIRKLYNDMTDCKDPMFWHDQWYALIEWADKHYKEAQKAFKKVKVRHQHLNKKKEHDPQVIPYNHWRIDEYLKACKVS